MKSSIIISSFLILTVFCFGQSTKEQKFKSTVKEIITAFSKQDSAAVEKYINKKIGVYQIDRIGLYEQYDNFHMISFSDTTYPQVLFSYSKGVKLLPLKYAALPTWDCDKSAWSKEGLFVDTTKTDHMITEMCKDRNNSFYQNVPAKTMKFFYNLEKLSRRIVLNDHNGTDLVFYLTYLNGNWYLTIIDDATSDCSV